MPDVTNDHLVLISGKAATGKSASLLSLEDPKSVMYLNCEGKRLPFKSEFQEFKVLDSLQVYEGITASETMPEVKTIVIDSLTYMMSMFQGAYVENSPNGLKAWGSYSTFFKKLMTDYVAPSTKNVIFTAHTADILNEAEMVNETLVKVQGNLMTFGIESFFGTVISSKKVPLKQLELYENEFLNITDDDRLLQFKYCYQTRLTKDTVNERIRGPLGMWSQQETFIDNNAQFVLNKLHEYYS